MNKLTFIKALWSPFKPFEISVYCGKTAIGVPYFLPRKWVKYSEEELVEEAYKAATNPKTSIKRSFPEWISYYRGMLKAVPRKMGFDFCSLGWKTKWFNDDYRFEHAPRLSFVCFGYQLAFTVIAEHQDQYWEAWLYYERNTDKTKSKEERIKQCIKEFSNTVTRHYGDGNQEKINYYNLILKSKYLKFVS